MPPSPSASSAPVALVTGANRGIGLGLVREFLDRNWRVIATCRSPGSADALEAMSTDSRLAIETLEVASAESVEALKSRLSGRPIDALVNNAGVFDADRRLGDVDYDEWRRILEVNLLGQVRVTEALLRNVLASRQKKIAVVSSALGSITSSWGGRYAYRSSKAAINMVFRSMAKDLAPEGVIVAVLSPGLVDTDLTQALDKPKISVEVSTQALADVIEGLTPEQSGRFLRYDGGELDW